MSSKTSLVTRRLEQKMSTKEYQRRQMARAVFRKAWILKRKTTVSSLAMALIIAWKVIKSETKTYYGKVKGVTYKNRQKILMRLARYSAEEVILNFVREPHNPFDYNAIRIIAEVRGKGKATIGYVSKETAANLAPRIDKGEKVIGLFEGVTGINRKRNLGCNYCYILL